MKQRGFTLLEALVATVVMGIAVTGLLSAISTSINNASRVTEYDRAALLARQKMDELILSHTVQPLVPIEGVFEPEFTGGTQTGWRAVITPFEAPPNAQPPATILERIQLEVWWVVGGQRKTFQLEGYRQSAMVASEVGMIQ